MGHGRRLRVRRITVRGQPPHSRRTRGVSEGSAGTAGGSTAWVSTMSSGDGRGGRCLHRDRGSSTSSRASLPVAMLAVYDRAGVTGLPPRSRVRAPALPKRAISGAGVRTPDGGSYGAVGVRAPALPKRAIGGAGVRTPDRGSYGAGARTPDRGG